MRKMIDAWISENGYLKRQDMNEAAEDIGVSDVQLKYYFTNSVGKPFLIWRKEMRIKEAMRIMREHPDRKLEAVAIDVGIYDARNFRRQFEETAGKSLSSWRKSLRKNK